MVGLADLKRHTDTIKRCQINVNNRYCYFYLSGLTTYEFLDILNYKSWLLKTYQKNVTVRYVNIIQRLEKGKATFRTSVGFAPLLMRYLRGKNFQIRDEDIEPFRARQVVFPDLKLGLYDFQERMIHDWLNVGGIGVIKSPTGSGKCPRFDTLILTNKGFIKIGDIVTKKTQTSMDDYFSEDNKNESDEIENVVSLKDSTNGYKYFKISDRHNIGIEDLISIKTSLGLKISGTKEHPIVIINKNGKLAFKKLQDITKEDHIAITYNTQVFNNDILELKYHYRFNKYSSNVWKLDKIKYMNEEIARLLGYIIAEANATIGNERMSNFNITNYDKEVNDDIAIICKNLGLDVNFKYEKDKNDGNPIGVIVNSIMFTDFIYYLGYKHLAQNKEVPWSILQANKSCQIEFIKALFDGDGTVYLGESKELVEFNSSSYELCRQLQIMLLNMGIIGRLDRKKGATLEYEGELRHYDDSYRLTFYGENVLKFAEIINFGLTRKKERLDECVEIIKNRGRWSDIVYPHLDTMFKTLYERLKEIGKNGINKDGKIFNSSYDFLKYNSFHKEIWAYTNGWRLPGRSTLEKILYLFSPIKDFDNLRKDLLKNSKNKQSDIYLKTYDYIQSLFNNFIFDSVEDIKEERDHVADITIEDAHSYVGNGMINHNTIVGCSAIKNIGRKTLILVHTSDLLINVWNDSLIKSFGPGIMGNVGIIGGNLTDSDRMDMKIGARSADFEENMKKDIVIGTFQTFNNRLDKLSQYKFGLMIVDECIPIDSEIWTKDGIIKYEDLDSDIFQVWSRDNNNRIVNNEYKKIKTRFKHMYRTIVETGDELVCSLDHKVLTRKDDGKEEFVEIEKAKNIARSILTCEEKDRNAELKRLYLKYIEKNASVKGCIRFNEWLNKVRGDFIFLDILSHEYRGWEQGYTLTVNKDHNYLVNGFVASNCHHVPAQMFRKVNATIRAPFKLGLSATVRRLDGLEKDVYGSIGDIQSSVSIRELINKGILAEPRFQSPIIVDDRVIEEIETCGQSGLMFSQFVKKSSASSEKKKNYIIDVCKNVAARDRKFLLFTDYVNKEDVFVRDMYAESLLGEGVRVAIIDQGMGSDERGTVFKFLESGEINGIVFGKLGSEGVNIPSVDVVVMANAIKSPITFTQRVGRVMRKIPGKEFADVYEVLLDIPTEYKWSEFNFAEYRAEGFTKLSYKVE